MIHPCTYRCLKLLVAGCILQPATNLVKYILNFLPHSSAGHVGDFDAPGLQLITDAVCLGKVLGLLGLAPGLHQSVDPVSYTHLDVYKRQPLYGTGGSGEGARYAHRGPHLYGRRVQAGDGGRCACVPDAH